jgi:hypothetical protein
LLQAKSNHGATIRVRIKVYLFSVDIGDLGLELLKLDGRTGHHAVGARAIAELTVEIGTPASNGAVGERAAMPSGCHRGGMTASNNSLNA